MADELTGATCCVYRSGAKSFLHLSVAPTFLPRLSNWNKYIPTMLVKKLEQLLREILDDNCGYNSTSNSELLAGHSTSGSSPINWPVSLNIRTLVQVWRLLLPFNAPLSDP